MSLADGPVGSGPLADVNPAAKLGATALLAAALVPSLDWVSASIALGFVLLVLIPLLGVPRRVLRRALVPVTVAAALGCLTVLLYGRPSGQTHLSFLLVNVTDGSITLAVATFLRTLAIALPAVVLFLTVDPTDLADSLIQRVRLPARFVIGSLAALRLVTLLVEDRESLSLARRARGLGDEGRLRAWVGLVFSLLVLSIRRGSKLSTAMEAKGFGAPVVRSWARDSRFGTREWLLLAGTAAVAALAVGSAVLTGHWNFVGAA